MRTVLIVFIVAQLVFFLINLYYIVSFKSQTPLSLLLKLALLPMHLKEKDIIAENFWNKKRVL